FRSMISRPKVPAIWASTDRPRFPRQDEVKGSHLSTGEFAAWFAPLLLLKGSIWPHFRGRRCAFRAALAAVPQCYNWCLVTSHSKRDTVQHIELPLKSGARLTAQNLKEHFCCISALP